MKNKVWTSERIRKEFAEDFKHLPGGHVPVVETKKKPSLFKRAAMYATLSLGLGVATVYTVDAAIPEYDGSKEVKICWECAPEDGVYKTPQDAIKAINPHANGKLIAQAEEEFIYINKLPHKDYSMFLKVGEYKIPVIKK